MARLYAAGRRAHSWSAPFGEGRLGDDLMRCHADPKSAAAPIQRRILAKDGHATSRMPPPEPAARDGLPTPLRANLEALSGFSLADVRVHGNSPEPARLGALAFARGGDIHLGPGQEKHLPHEAWHVVQQKQGRVQATTQMMGASVNDDPALEHAADRMGSQAVATHPPEPELPAMVRPDHGAAVVQRKPIPAKKPKPDKSVPIHGPPPASWSLLARDLPGWRTESDDEIYAPLQEAKAREQQELEAEKTQKLDLLRINTKAWRRQDQDFALELLARVFRYSTNIDPRGVSDANRQPILSRYEQWLRAVDEQRLKECADKPLGVVAKSQAAFRGDKPCVSWFSNEWSLGRSYASSKIEDMDRQLRINRGALSNAVDQIYWDVFLYRKETDPEMLQMQADAAGMVDALSGLAHSPTREPLQVGTFSRSKLAAKPVPEKPVWVQLRDGANSEFHPSEIRGSHEVNARVKTPLGPGVVVSRDEPPYSNAVKHPPDPNYVEPRLRPTSPKERLIDSEKHHPASESPTPPNVGRLYKHSVEELNGVRWAKDADGTIHRFSKPSNGTRHWNGSTAGVDPITPNEVPIEVRRHFGVRK